MTSSKFRRAGLLALLSIVTIVLAVRCGGVEEEPFYIPDQFILIGTADDVNQVVELLAASIEGQVDPVETLELDAIWQSEDVEIQAQLDELRASLADSPVMLLDEEQALAATGMPLQLWQQLLSPEHENVATLYELSDSEQPLEDVVPLIQDIVRALESQNSVLVDLNYLTGAPWEIGGAPWEIGGAADSVPEAMNAEFWNQWAFGQSSGVGLIDSSGNRVPGASMGDSQDIVLFDTSPFTDTVVVGSHPFTGQITPTLNLVYDHPFQLDKSIPPSKSGVNVEDHGVFVAGLAHGMAPGSDIRLVRVLNEEARGTMFDLIKAIAMELPELAIKYVTQSNSRTGPNGTIMNFSLTVKNETGKLPKPMAKTIGELMQLSGYLAGNCYDSASQRPPGLDVAFELLYQLGGVSVAAAGNDSADLSTKVPARLPAAYCGVIGVEAANQSREASCYSNDAMSTAASTDLSDVRAPGGDGGPETAPGPGTSQPSNPSQCYPRHNDCNSPAGQCEYGVISLTHSPASTPKRDGYGVWVGSSFASPIVAGLAALELESGTDAQSLTNRSAFGLNPTLIPASTPVILDVTSSLSTP